MITGIGADITEVSRVKRALERTKGFAARVFTAAEREYCLSGSNPAQRFAGRFAAKEAAAKSLGASLSWSDVEILPDKQGKPVVRLLNTAEALAAGRRVMVSIAHCRSYAVAYAVAVSDEGSQ
ncbi:MAG TPA: holo-ACP synthase [Armatimonadota bacterium]|nr:holo-ACP synthase [Armatimonadota bacterium]